MEQLEQYANTMAELLNKREKYQRIVGKIAYEVTNTFGPSALNQLLELVKETHGRTTSISTLRNYRWVYERTKDLSLPEDIAYQVLQRIAGSKDPSAWSKRIIEEGLSSAEAYRLLGIENGVKTRTVLCPHCQKPVNV